MKRIAVLLDFTEGCEIALKQAQSIANLTGADLYALNIVADENQKAETIEKIKTFVQRVTGNTNAIAQADAGDLFFAAPRLLQQIDPDLVVVGTHGIHGIRQKLFGAHILKLIQAIPYPSLVVQENTNGIEFPAKILFPIGPHADYHKKISQTLALAKATNSEVVVYEIEKPGVVLSEQHIANRKAAIEAFENENIRFSRVVEEANTASLGYSRQTIKYAEATNIDIITILAQIPHNDIYMGVADKETLLTNESGIPVLACNF